MSSTVAAAVNTLVIVVKNNWMENRLISGDVSRCLSSCTLFSFIELSCHEGNSHCSNIIADCIDSRCLSTGAFVKEIESFFDNFSPVPCNPNHGKVSCCRWSSTSKHLEYWQNSASKIKSWTFLNKECELIRPTPSQTAWFYYNSCCSACVEKGEWREEIQISWHLKPKSDWAW